MQLEGVRAFGTEMAARDRRARIAFNRDQLAVLVEDHLPATHAAVGANGAGKFGVLVLGKKISVRRLIASGPVPSPPV